MKVQDKIAVVTGGGLGEGIAPKDALDMMVDMQIPFKKYQTPEDIGKAVTFLSSSEAEEITGQSLNICGGMAFN
ncbi:MAG: SDR family oxidoreductase [Proteobacteria bacterium]|nr:SDR family oxidoreductase [Pseudomonadota bacterium]